MFGFSKNDNVENTERVRSTRKAQGFALGLTMLFISVAWFIPKDLFTTAKWLDGSGIGLLYVNEASAFAPGSFWDISNVTAPVSTEAFRFAVLIMVAQLALGYASATAGSYIKGRECDSLLQLLFSWGTVKVEQVNWSKITMLLAFLGVAAVDTWTDWQFTSKDGRPELLIIAFVISLLVYNIGSEWLFIMGAQWTIGNAPEAISGVFSALGAIISAPFASDKKRPQSAQPPQNNQNKQKQQGNQKSGSNNSNQSRNNNNGNQSRQNEAPRPQQSQAPNPNREREIPPHILALMNGDDSE